MIFTSGGTEANMLALTPAIETAAEKRPRDRLLISAIEHASVRTRRPVSARRGRRIAGRRPTAASILRRLARAPWLGASRPLVSIMLANNETGVVQPVAEAAAIVHAAGGLLHVDAVQAAGRIPAISTSSAPIC